MYSSRAKNDFFGLHHTLLNYFFMLTHQAVKAFC